MRWNSNLEDSLYSRFKANWEDETRQQSSNEGHSNGVVLLTKYDVGKLLENQEKLLRYIGSMKEKQEILAQDVLKLRTTLESRLSSATTTSNGWGSCVGQEMSLPQVFKVKILLHGTVLPKVLTARLEHAIGISEGMCTPSKEGPHENANVVQSIHPLSTAFGLQQSRSVVGTPLMLGDPAASQLEATLPKHSERKRTKEIARVEGESSSQPARSQKKSDYFPLEPQFDIFIDDSSESTKGYYLTEEECLQLLQKERELARQKKRQRKSLTVVESACEDSKDP